jgi:hypothetical protein
MKRERDEKSGIEVEKRVTKKEGGQEINLKGGKVLGRRK